MNLSRTQIGLIAVILFLLSLGGCTVSKYNGLVQQDEAVTRSWSDLQSAYQRRADAAKKAF